MIDVIGKRKIYLSVSAGFVVLSLAAIVFWGLKAGIDLKGGTAWQIEFKREVTVEDVKSALREGANSEPSVVQAGDGSFILRFKDLGEEEHQKVLNFLKEKLGDLEEKNFSSIGPTIGSELRRRAVVAVFFVLFAISVFIAWAFRKVSEPVKSWKYGLITLLTLAHDVLIPTGLLAALGKGRGIEIDTNFIVALLVVMGFSVHDTIVVFDRIRENLQLFRGKNIPFGDLINRSVNETFARSVNTSLTLVFVLLALLFVGPTSLFYFVLTILVGTLVGTYSSIFVASPMLYLWGRK